MNNTPIFIKTCLTLAFASLGLAAQAAPVELGAATKDASSTATAINITHAFLATDLPWPTYPAGTQPAAYSILASTDQTTTGDLIETVAASTYTLGATLAPGGGVPHQRRLFYFLDKNPLTIVAGSTVSIQGLPADNMGNGPIRIYLRSVYPAATPTTITNAGTFEVASTATLAPANRTTFVNTGSINFRATGFLESTGSVLNNTGRIEFFPASGIANSGNINNQTGGKITANLPIYLTASNGVITAVNSEIKLAAATQLQGTSNFVIQSATDQVINPNLVFRAGSAATAKVVIGGGGGKITLPASVDTQTAQLQLAGSIAVSTTGTTNVSATNLEVAAGSVLHFTQCPASFMTSATTLVTNTVATITTLPAATPVRCVAANGRSYTGVASVDSASNNSIVVAPAAWSADPISAIPVNTPLGLGLTALALAFLGRKRIKTALGA